MSTMKEMLILVDVDDCQIGIGEKMVVHRTGWLHRCFSIIVLNAQGEVLLQKRAASKYHSGGLWTNTCCGHPRSGEETASAAHRRLEEEMGFDCDLEEIFSFIYRAKLDSGLTEHELDHVFVGQYNDTITPHPDEADGYRWVTVDELMREIARQPETYTVWSRIAFQKLHENNLLPCQV